MTEAAEARIRTILAFLVTVAVAVWVGGAVIVDALAMPAAFEVLPREQAGDLGRAVFPRLNYVECGLGVVTVLLAFALGRSGWGTRQRHFLAGSFLALMTMVALTDLLFVTPAMADASGDDTGSLHVAYALLETVKLAGGVGVLWLLASRSSR